MFSLLCIHMPGLLTNDHSLNYGIVNLNCYHSFFSNYLLKTPLDNFSRILLVVTQYCLLSILPNYYLYCGLKNVQSFLNLFSIWLSFFMPYTHLANPTPIFLQIHGLLMSFLLNLRTEKSIPAQIDVFSSAKTLFPITFLVSQQQIELLPLWSSHWWLHCPQLTGVVWIPAQEGSACSLNTILI